MVNYNANRVKYLTIDINALINLKQISNQEFFQDVERIKKNSKDQNLILNFQTKYIQLFDGTLRDFATTNKIGKPSIDSFLGSIRLMNNPNYFLKTKDPLIIRFNQDLRKNLGLPEKKVKKKKGKSKSKSKSKSKKIKKVSTKKLNPLKAKTKFHKFYRQINYIQLPLGYEKKTEFIYEFKQRKQLKKLQQTNLDIESLSIYVNNYNSEIEPKLDTDIPILLDFFHSYYINKDFRFLVGISVNYETLDSQNRYVDNDSFGVRTSLHRKKVLLEGNILQKLQELSDWFSKITRSKAYYIFNSKIFITFYTEKGISFNF